MTTFRSVNVTCAVCGTESEQERLISTNTMGPPDLDTRPAPMARDTLRFAMARCPQCGYCAPELDEAAADTRAVLMADAYQQQLHNADLPELANTFLCWALVCEAEREYSRGGWAALSAAWVCDDTVLADASQAERTDQPFDLAGNRSYAEAMICRRRAIALFLAAREYVQVFMQGEGAEELLLTDLYRRCGEFMLAEQTAGRGLNKASDAVIISILRGQLALILAHDIDAHTIPEAIALTDQPE
jgi:hypothetical protein